MTSFINFTALSGAMKEEPACYLLDIDDFRILLDCGTTDDFTFHESYLEKVRSLQPQPHMVLLSHPELSQMGALPFLELDCPIFATIPTIELGRLALEDALRCAHDSDKHKHTTIAKVRQKMDRVKALRYMQTHLILDGPGAGIAITPHNAGHTLGGAVWRITKDNEDIIYAVKFNHKKERLLSPFSIESMGKSTIMITDTYNIQNTQVQRKQRDNDILECVLTAVAKSGSCLLPVTSSTRVLELAMFLDAYWTQNQIKAPLLWVSHVAEKVRDSAKTMIEWCGDNVAKIFESTKETPFDFKRLQIVSPDDLDSMQDVPRVILASLPTLHSSPALSLFAKMATSPANVVLLTQRNLADTADLSRTLFGACREGKYGELSTPVSMTIHKRVPLEGFELLEEQQKSYRQAKIGKDLADEEDEEEEEGEDSSDDEMAGPSGLDTSLHGKAEALTSHMTGAKQAQQSSFDLTYDVFPALRDLKAVSSTRDFFRADTAPRVYLFPFQERRAKEDEYGEFIDEEMFKTQETLDLEQAGNAAVKAEQNDVQPTVVKREIPTKLETSHVELVPKCRIKYIDLEGLSDGRSIKNIVRKLNPRKLILIGGSETDTQHLFDYMIKSKEVDDKATQDIFLPRLNDVINVSSASNIWQARIDEALRYGLQSMKIKQYEIAGVRAHIKLADPTAICQLTMPWGQLEEATQSSTLFIGDARLSELRTRLHTMGVSAEFDAKGGLHVGGGNLYVSKVAGDEDQLRMEGSFCEEYWVCRDLIYEHAIACIQ